TGIAGRWIDRSQQCDAVRASARHIEINACNIGEWRPVLMALEQEVTAVVKPRRGSAGIVVEHEIGVLVGLGLHASAQHAGKRDHAARVLQRLDPGRDDFELEVGIDHGRGSADALVRIRHAVLDVADAVAGPRKSRGPRGKRYCPKDQWKTAVSY